MASPNAELLESRAPIVVFAPLPGASESERREYFLGGTIHLTTQSTNAALPGVQGEKYNTHQSGSCTIPEMPAAAAAMLGGSGQQRTPVARDVDCDMSAQRGDIAQNKPRRLRSSSLTTVNEIVQQDNNGEADNREASTTKRRRIDDTDRRDISPSSHDQVPALERDIQPELRPAHSNQPIVIPLQLSLSLSCPLMPTVPSLYRPA